MQGQSQICNSGVAAAVLQQHPPSLFSCICLNFLMFFFNRIFVYLDICRKFVSFSKQCKETLPHYFGLVINECHLVPEFCINSI